MYLTVVTLSPWVRAYCSFNDWTSLISGSNGFMGNKADQQKNPNYLCQVQYYIFSLINFWMQELMCDLFQMSDFFSTSPTFKMTIWYLGLGRNTFIYGIDFVKKKIMINIRIYLVQGSATFRDVRAKRLQFTKFPSFF